MTSDNPRSQDSPHVELIPADEQRGHCPTLRVDGVVWHDPVQPYRPVFAIEGAKPDVVALFGLGLGYNAAGALQLSPEARVVAWEPIEPVRSIAETLLRDEWRIADRVAVESEAADFQARLLAACRGARSLASLEVPALREREPELGREYRRVVQEVVDADTLTSLPADGWQLDPSEVLRHVADHPRLMQVAGPWRGQTALLMADVPDENTRSAIARCHGSCQIVAPPRVATALARAGLQPDLVVVRDADPPSEETCSALSESLVGVTPDSHPAWWTAPSAGRFVLGHSGVAWMLPDGDPGHVLSYRWGAEVPMAVAALTLGAKRLVPVGFERSPDAHWNWLAPSRRRHRILRRLASQTGAEVLDWTGSADELPAVQERAELRTVLDRAEPLGPATLKQGLDRSLRALSTLRRESDRMADSLPANGVAAYASHRAEADPFTRVYVAGPISAALDAGATQLTDLSSIWSRAAANLERCYEKLGASPDPGRAGTACDVHDGPFKVFLGRARELPLPAAVLEAQVRRMAGSAVQVARLDDALSERFGPRARSLPIAAQKLLIPAACGFDGRALYLEPSVLVFGDVTELAGCRMEGFGAMAPLEAPASLLLVDASRADWDAEKVLSAAANDPGQLESLLLPSASRGVGQLAPAWCGRDGLSLEASAVRLTCEPWMPWLSGHHPAAWAWEAMLAAALADGAVSPRQLADAAEARALRPELAQSASNMAVRGTNIGEAAARGASETAGVTP